MSDSQTPLPPFDMHGNLPSGDFWPTEADFEERFVRVHGSNSRAEIYDGFKRHRAELLTAGVDRDSDCMLDGSYTTSKLDPGDIDLVVEIDAALFLGSARVQELLSGPDAKPEFCCDAYPLIVLPENDPNYTTVTAQGRAYWRKWFGRDRQNRQKGRVWTKAQGFR